MLDSVRATRWQCIVCGSVWLIGAAVWAQQTVDDAPAKKFAAEYARAWNAGDVDALNRMWTEDGELIDAQGLTVDRKALLANRAGKPRGQRPVLAIALDKVRLVAPSVALVEGESKLTALDGSPVQRTRFAGVLVERDGAWRIRLIRQLATRHAPQPPPEEPFKEVEWMLGEWAGVGERMRVHTSADWDLDHRYVVFRSVYEPENGPPYEAEVRLGWDPENLSYKSWYFDSRGVTSTTKWHRADGHWLGDIKGVQSDGAPFTGTMAITRIDNDSYLRTLTNLEVNDQTVPDMEVRLFRVPAEVDKKEN